MIARGRNRHPTLAEALAYQNEDIVFRFAKVFQVPFEEADDIFTEVKKWLWVGRLRQPERLLIHGPLRIIDEMWHNFILFTRDYVTYCDEVYGGYVHHAPVTRRELEAHARRVASLDMRGRARERRRQVAQMRFIATHLGVDTLRKWYVEYPSKYGVSSPVEISRAALPPHVRSTSMLAA